MKYEDQGLGVLYSHVAVAKEMLRQDGKKQTEENIFFAVQQLAEEKAESYTPSEEMGMNPKSRVSKRLKTLAMPQVLDEKYLMQRFGSRTKAANVAGSMQAAITNLSQTIMENYWGFQVQAVSGKADPADQSQLSVFSYLKKSGRYSAEEIKEYNKAVDVYRDLRLVVQTYIFHAIRPLIMNVREGIDQALVEMGYGKLTPAQVKSDQHKRILLLEFTKVFTSFFKTHRFSDFLILRKWSTDGKRLLPAGKSKPSLPSTSRPPRKK